MLRLIMAVLFGVFGVVSSSFAGMRDAPPPDQHGADYRLPYGTYSGGYSNWRNMDRYPTKTCQDGNITFGLVILADSV